MPRSAGREKRKHIIKKMGKKLRDGAGGDIRRNREIGGEAPSGVCRHPPAQCSSATRRRHGEASA